MRQYYLHTVTFATSHTESGVEANAREIIEALKIEAAR
jgi:hypothetical protein